MKRGSVSIQKFDVLMNCLRSRDLALRPLLLAPSDLLHPLQWILKNEMGQSDNVNIHGNATDTVETDLEMAIAVGVALEIAIIGVAAVADLVATR